MAAGRALTLPFAGLNLTRNPFGELDPEEWAALALVDLEPLLASLSRPRCALQLLGAQGRGKTTHLRALARALPQAVLVRAWSDRPLEVPACEVLLLDEADAVWPWQRWRAVRRADAVAVATHIDLSPSLRLAGFKPATVPIDGLSAPRLREALQRRIEAFRRGPGPVPELTTAKVDDLVARHGSDVRAVVEELYEWVQGGCDDVG